MIVLNSFFRCCLLYSIFYCAVVAPFFLSILSASSYAFSFLSLWAVRVLSVTINSQKRLFLGIGSDSLKFILSMLRHTLFSALTYVCRRTKLFMNRSYCDHITPRSLWRNWRESDAQLIKLFYKCFLQWHELSRHLLQPQPARYNWHFMKSFLAKWFSFSSPIVSLQVFWKDYILTAYLSPYKASTIETKVEVQSYFQTCCRTWTLPRVQFNEKVSQQVKENHRESMQAFCKIPLWNAILFSVNCSIAWFALSPPTLLCTDSRHSVAKHFHVPTCPRCKAPVLCHSL